MGSTHGYWFVVVFKREKKNLLLENDFVSKESVDWSENVGLLT
jgi:hypothetical protein